MAKSSPFPAEKGDTRNLTNTSGAAERNPSWSPDGKTIAYFSDASGEYQLYLHDQTGFKAPTVIDLGPDPSYFYDPTWSPDSKHIAYTDKHLRLWMLDVPSRQTGACGSTGHLRQLRPRLQRDVVARFEVDRLSARS